MPQVSVPLASFGHLAALSASQGSFTSEKGTRHETMCGPYKAAAVASPPRAILMLCSSASREHRFAELGSIFQASTSNVGQIVVAIRQNCDPLHVKGTASTELLIA